ncbi:MAG TPA: ABC transporter permease [Halanaerobiales bacterium]|nr:ABC transporter permease [Halanaerobiales bacterium]
MNKLFRNCLYQGKNLFRDPGFLFWALMYPIILFTFFNLAFSGMMNYEPVNINVGVKNDSQIAYILKDIDFLNVHEISGDEIAEKLKSGDISAFIDSNLNLKVAGSGINQTIIKEVVEQIKQTFVLNRPLEKIDFSVDYLEDRNQEANNVAVTFYALIAMVSLYGIFAGIETVSLIQANLSDIGVRINVTPLKKGSFLLAGTIDALLLNLMSNGILLLFITFILRITLFYEFFYSIILIIMGNFLGVALGIFVGASNKKSEDAKSLMAIAITLFLSFLSGLMGPWIKVMLDQKAPLLSRLNPVSIITNNLYRLNFLGSSKSAGEGILFLAFYCIVLILGAYLFLRRKKYDSV